MAGASGASAEEIAEAELADFEDAGKDCSWQRWTNKGTGAVATLKDVPWATIINYATAFSVVQRNYIDPAVNVTEQWVLDHGTRVSGRVSHILQLANAHLIKDDASDKVNTIANCKKVLALVKEAAEAITDNDLSEWPAVTSGKPDGLGSTADRYFDRVPGEWKALNDVVNPSATPLTPKAAAAAGGPRAGSSAAAPGSPASPPSSSVVASASSASSASPVPHLSLAGAGGTSRRMTRAAAAAAAGPVSPISGGDTARREADALALAALAASRGTGAGGPAKGTRAGSRLTEEQEQTLRTRTRTTSWSPTRSRKPAKVGKGEVANTAEDFENTAIAKKLQQALQQIFVDVSVYRQSRSVDETIGFIRAHKKPYAKDLRVTDAEVASILQYLLGFVIVPFDTLGISLEDLTNKMIPSFKLMGKLFNASTVLQAAQMVSNAVVAYLYLNTATHVIRTFSNRMDDEKRLQVYNDKDTDSRDTIGKWVKAMMESLFTSAATKKDNLILSRELLALLDTQYDATDNERVSIMTDIIDVLRDQPGNAFKVSPSTGIAAAGSYVKAKVVGTNLGDITKLAQKLEEATSSSPSSVPVATPVIDATAAAAKKARQAEEQKRKDDAVIWQEVQKKVKAKDAAVELKRKQDIAAAAAAAAAAEEARRKALSEEEKKKEDTAAAAARVVAAEELERQKAAASKRSSAGLSASFKPSFSVSPALDPPQYSQYFVSSATPLPRPSKYDAPLAVRNVPMYDIGWGRMWWAPVNNNASLLITANTFFKRVVGMSVNKDGSINKDVKIEQTGTKQNVGFLVICVNLSANPSKPIPLEEKTVNAIGDAREKYGPDLPFAVLVFNTYNITPSKLEVGADPKRDDCFMGSDGNVAPIVVCPVILSGLPNAPVTTNALRQIADIRDRIKLDVGCEWPGALPVIGYGDRPQNPGVHAPTPTGTARVFKTETKDTLKETFGSGPDDEKKVSSVAASVSSSGFGNWAASTLTTLATLRGASTIGLTRGATFLKGMLGATTASTDPTRTPQDALYSRKSNRTDLYSRLYDAMLAVPGLPWEANIIVLRQFQKAAARTWGLLHVNSIMGLDETAHWTEWLASECSFANTVQMIRATIVGANPGLDKMHSGRIIPRALAAETLAAYPLPGYMVANALFYFHSPGALLQLQCLTPSKKDQVLIIVYKTTRPNIPNTHNIAWCNISHPESPSNLRAVAACSHECVFDQGLCVHMDNALSADLIETQLVATRLGQPTETVFANSLVGYIARAYASYLYLTRDQARSIANNSSTIFGTRAQTLQELYQE